MREWEQVLDTLRAQMTRATFDRILSGSEAEEDGECLAIRIENGLMIDWLENRLNGQISQAIKSVTGREYKIRYEVKQAEPVQESFLVEGDYETERDKIIQPDKVAVCTQYFRQEWVPLLGAPLAWAIFELRQRCYWNSKTGELRDECKLKVSDLAAAVGVSTRTLQRQMGQKRDLLALFITKKRQLRKYSNRQGKEVTVSTVWKVKMTDPLTPEDQERLESLGVTKCHPHRPWG